ncbi:eCIS core domain-containing protein [Rhodocaloribacter sp.]
MTLSLTHQPVSKPTPVRAGVLQRKCACGGTRGPTGECAGCRKKRRGQRDRPSASHESVSANVHEAIRDSGKPLDSETRNFMEPRFGHDFGNVRVHTGTQADRAAREVHASAFTVGRDIVFRNSRFAPDTPEGKRLLAHELTHTIQQKTGSATPDGLTVSHPGDRAEKEAQATAHAVMQARSTSPPSLRSPQIARDDLGGGASPAPPSPAPAPTAPSPAAPAPAASLPTVTLGNFRNSGNTHSENNCGLCPLPLGILTTSGKNRMELRGVVSGHQPSVQYDFKRTKERATWKKVSGSWTQLSHVGPGADDDSHDQDEDLTPKNNHIYVEDGPGFRSLSNPVGDTSATEAVYKASFIEFVKARKGSGSWTKVSGDFEWHSISWLEKSGGSWGRKSGANEIETGSTPVGTGNP